MRKGPFKIRAFLAGGAGLILLAAVFSFVLLPHHVLRIKDISNGKIVLESPVTPGDNLWLVFINSVENLPVADHFVITENFKIEFTETIYQAPYAGYDGAERAELVAPGTLKISGYNRQMDAYTFFAGDISRHMLFLNGNWLPLYDVARGGDLIEITVETKRTIFYE